MIYLETNNKNNEWRDGRMEQNNNTNVVDTKVNELMDNMKAQISAEVKAELQEKGIEIVPLDYSAGAEIVKIVDDYQATIKKIDDEMKHNEETYKADIVKMKNIELQLDKKDALYEANKKLDKTLEKQEMIHNQKIEKIRNSQEYKDNRAENLQLLSMLKGCDVPTEQMLDLIGDMCKAEDMKVLGVVKTMFGDNVKASFTIDKAISGIEESRANSELKMMINTMKMYIEDGNENLRVFSYFKQYRK